LSAKNKSRFPHDDRQQFKDAILFTATETNFDAYLIEKDYFCSLVLHSLSNSKSKLYFKGGTLLSKVYAGFNRLSEDLDFTVPLSPKAKRAERSSAVSSSKELFLSLPSKINGFEISKSLKGSNNCIQYNGEITYQSCIDQQDNRILFEIGLREELLTPYAVCDANTLVINPLTGKVLFPIFQITALSKKEAYAEKIRAALTRERAAIRDLYDVNFAIQKLVIKQNDKELLRLAAQKVEIGGSVDFQLHEQRKKELKEQVHTQLRSVLRSEDFKQFDFEQAWIHLSEVAESVRSHLSKSE
jgi:predicted nucleotidyltransferase component of viral defense system